MGLRPSFGAVAISVGPAVVASRFSASVRAYSLSAAFSAQVFGVCPVFANGGSFAKFAVSPPAPVLAYGGAPAVLAVGFSASVRAYSLPATVSAEVFGESAVVAESDGSRVSGFGHVFYSVFSRICNSRICNSRIW